jgi:hypothetical protein
MVNKFKSMLSSIRLSPFNREIWSKGTYVDFGPSSGPSPGPAPEPSPAPSVIPGESRHKHRKHEKEPTTYEALSEQVCAQFGICNYKNDEAAAHKEAENATDAEARDKAAGDKGPMSNQK